MFMCTCVYLYMLSIYNILLFFTCVQLNKVYKVRDDAIKKCIGEVSDKVKELREQKNKDPDNFDILRSLRKEQTSVSIILFQDI